MSVSSITIKLHVCESPATQRHEGLRTEAPVCRCQVLLATKLMYMHTLVCLHVYGTAGLLIKLLRLHIMSIVPCT